MDLSPKVKLFFGILLEVVHFYPFVIATSTLFYLYYLKCDHQLLVHGYIFQLSFDSIRLYSHNIPPTKMIYFRIYICDLRAARGLAQHCDLSDNHKTGYTYF